MNDSYFGDVNEKYCIFANNLLFTKIKVKFAYIDIALTYLINNTRGKQH